MCDAVTTAVLTVNPVHTKPNPGFGLKEETREYGFSTLDVTGPTSGLAADVGDDAAVAAGVDLPSVIVVT